jgi:hypothetical protein
MTTNAEAAESTLEALRELGRLEAVDSAKVQAVRSLAVAVDIDPQNASLWREYRAALADLLEDADGGIDEFAELLRNLRTEVRHPEDAGTAD